MNDSNTASVRTAWTAGVVTALAYFAHVLLDIEISTSDPVMIAVAIGVVGILHRAFLVLSELVPYFGYIVFGINRSPEYSPPPPSVPALAGEDDGFAEGGTIWTVVGILAIVALIIWILARL